LPTLENEVGYIKDLGINRYHYYELGYGI